MELLVGHSNCGGTDWLISKAIDNALSIPNSLNVVVGDNHVKAEYILPHECSKSLKKKGVCVSRDENKFKFDNGSEIVCMIFQYANFIKHSKKTNILYLDDFTDFQIVGGLEFLDIGAFSNLYGCQSRRAISRSFTYKCDFKRFSKGVGGILTKWTLESVGHGMCSVAMSKNEALNVKNSSEIKMMCGDCNCANCIRYGDVLVVSDSCPKYVEMYIRSANEGVNLE